MTDHCLPATTKIPNLSPSSCIQATQYTPKQRSRKYPGKIPGINSSRQPASDECSWNASSTRHLIGCLLILHVLKSLQIGTAPVELSYTQTPPSESSNGTTPTTALCRKLTPPSEVWSKYAPTFFLPQGMSERSPEG